MELRTEETDVSTLARTVADEFVPALAAHESKLEVRLTGEPVVAVCDPERVAQIMRILIDNALNHTRARDRRDRRDLDARRRARASRSPTSGRASRARSSLACSSRSTPPTARAARASGLAIAHELAERMGGELAVESLPGRTTFSLEIPA